MTAIGGHFQTHGFRIRFISTLLTQSTFTHDASILNCGCETSSKAQASGTDSSDTDCDSSASDAE